MTDHNLSRNKLALKFDVSRGTMSNIMNGKTWGHIQLDADGNLIDESKDDERYQDILQNLTEKVGELKAQQVSDIKYIAQQDYLSSKELSELYGVNVKTINNIKNGTTWGEIGIDYVEPIVEPVVKEVKKRTVFRNEPLPEFIVPRKTELDKAIADDKKDIPIPSSEELETIGLKFEFLESLWDMKSKHSNYKGKRFVGGRMICTNKWFNSWLHNHWSKKYSPYGKLRLDEYIAQAAMIVQDSTLKFRMDDVEYWKKLLDEDDSSLRIFFSYMQKAIENEMKNHGNWLSNVIVRERKVNKEKFYEYISIGNNSVNELVKDDEEDTALLNVLSDDARLFGDLRLDELSNAIKHNRVNHFLQFFETYKRYFLTENQYHSWEILKATEHVPGGAGYTENDRESYFGMSRDKASSTRQAVRKRALEAYKEMYPDNFHEDKNKSKFIENENKRRIKILQGFINIVYGDSIDPEKMNATLSKYVAEQLDSYDMYFHDLIHENLSVEDIKSIVGSYYDNEVASKTLYKLCVLIENELKVLNRFNPTTVKFYRKKEEYQYDRQVIDVNEYRSLFQKSEQKTRKKHTALRLMTNGHEFRIDNTK